MAIQQVQQPANYTDQVLRAPDVMPSGRWESITYETQVPTSALTAGVKAPVSVAIGALKAVVALAEGGAQIRYAAGANPSFVASRKNRGREETASYRLRDHAILSTSLMTQPPSAAVVMAGYLLATRADAALTDAFQILLARLADQTTTDTDRNEAAVIASHRLVEALDTTFDADGVRWFAHADPAAGEIDESLDPAALPLDGLFADAEVFGKFVAGESTDYDLLVKQNPTAFAAGDDLATDDPNAFYGPQKDLAVRFMRAGKHVLHHGPTGTGKSYVWDLAMREVEGDSFDANDYPYFVHGSAGLEDVDFLGSILPRPDGSKVWIDGPLVKAMKAGKRLKVEEMNRLPGSMLNVLLGAMDYGRIALTRHEGEVILAAPGFAVDAMANVGQEYTATEVIDPAILRRFHIKIEYSFLPPEQEVALLRSRHSTLEREDAETLVRIANTIREAYEYGGGSDLDVDLYVSPAALLNTAELVAGGTSISEAIDLTWAAEVAHTKAKREKVRAVIDQNIRDRRIKGRRKTS